MKLLTRVMAALWVRARRQLLIRLLCC